MALGTLFGQGGAIAFAHGATQHETNILGVREVMGTTGGEEFVTADGVVHRNPSSTTVVALEVTLYQDLTSANLWRYLRETTPGAATLKITGTSSTTEGVSNPEWNYTVTGWEQPILDWSAGSPPTTPVARYTVSGNPTVDVTP